MEDKSVPLHRHPFDFPVRRLGTYRLWPHDTPPSTHSPKGPRALLLHLKLLSNYHQMCGRAHFPGPLHLSSSLDPPQFAPVTYRASPCPADKAKEGINPALRFSCQVEWYSPLVPSRIVTVASIWSFPTRLTISSSVGKIILPLVRGSKWIGMT